METLGPFLPLIVLAIVFFLAPLCYYIYKGYVGKNHRKTKQNLISSPCKKLITLRTGKIVDYTTDYVFSTTEYLIKDIVVEVQPGIYSIVTHYFSVFLILSILIMLSLEFSILNPLFPIFGTSQHNLTDTVKNFSFLLLSWPISDLFLKLFLCAFLKPKIPHTCILEKYCFLLAYKTNNRRHYVSNKWFLLGGRLLY